MIETTDIPNLFFLERNIVYEPLIQNKGIKNITLTIQTMAQFTLIFTTRHRKGYAVERDCMIIGACLTKYTPSYKCIYNGKELIVFHVYGANKKARVGIMTLIFERLQSLTYFQSFDLQSYTIK